MTKRLHERLMARKKIYVIAATFQDKYIIRFVVCSRVTESRDIAFAWEEIRTEANHVLSDSIDHEARMPPYKKQHATVKAPVSNNIIGPKMNRAHDFESENVPVTKKSRFVHEDMDLRIEVSKETLLPSYSNGMALISTNSNEVKMGHDSSSAVTLIQAEALVLDNSSIKEVQIKRRVGQFLMS